MYSLNINIRAHISYQTSSDHIIFIWSRRDWFLLFNFADNSPQLNTVRRSCCIAMMSSECARGLFITLHKIHSASLRISRCTLNALLTEQYEPSGEHIRGNAKRLLFSYFFFTSNKLSDNSYILFSFQRRFSVILNRVVLTTITIAFISRLHGIEAISPACYSGSFSGAGSSHLLRSCGSNGIL